MIMLLLLLNLFAVFFDAVDGLEDLRPLEEPAVTLQKQQFLTVAYSSLLFCLATFEK